eukprot:TRINITY_DN1750_c0_g1_i2.p1 TRINITY_DN1750_c0_g1~~TRINITY_DN1750_c0_g1_i2.p1  ORF type:complete len:265 (+),score=58.43 TRINITY_DN1750_c0_g1_i2:53-796(+)
MEEWDAYLSVVQRERYESVDFLGLDGFGDTGVSAKATQGSGSATGSTGGLDDIFAPSAGSPVNYTAPPQASNTRNKTLAEIRLQQGGGDDLFMQGTAQEALGPNKMMQQLMSYYELLGLTEIASLEDIRVSYKQKSLKLHPDRNPNLHEDDQQMFKLITKAHEVLSDPVTRQQYDMEQRMKNQPAQTQQTGGNWLYHLGGQQQQQQAPQFAPQYSSPMPSYGSPSSAGQSSSSPRVSRSADPFSNLF